MKSIRGERLGGEFQKEISNIKTHTNNLELPMQVLSTSLYLPEMFQM